MKKIDYLFHVTEFKYLKSILDNGLLTPGEQIKREIIAPRPDGVFCFDERDNETFMSLKLKSMKNFGLKSEIAIRGDILIKVNPHILHDYHNFIFLTSWFKHTEGVRSFDGSKYSINTKRFDRIINYYENSPRYQEVSEFRFSGSILDFEKYIIEIVFMPNENNEERTINLKYNLNYQVPRSGINIKNIFISRDKYLQDNHDNNDSRVNEYYDKVHLMKKWCSPGKFLSCMIIFADYDNLRFLNISDTIRS